MEKFVYQKFILGIQNIDEALAKGLSGVIFFKDDIKDEKQFISLINLIKTKAIIPPFLSIDQEGGRVERTENIRPKRISARFAWEKGEEFFIEQSNEILSELKNYGINLNFAPCIDVNTNSQNPIIGERAFSDSTDKVIKASKIFIEASRRNKIIPCVKHFPGHGDADKDSHLTLPQIDLSLEEMEKIHIKPFKSAIDDGIEMIMVAHLHCTCFDKEVIPSSLSKNVIGYLRNDLNYQGVIISDDMFMKGVQDYGSLEAVLMGIRAGVDMFIFRDSDKNTLDMIEELVNLVERDEVLRIKILESNKRIEILKQKWL